MSHLEENGQVEVMIYSVVIFSSILCAVVVYLRLSVINSILLKAQTKEQEPMKMESVAVGKKSLSCC